MQVRSSLGRFLDWGLRVRGWGFGWGRVSVRVRGEGGWVLGRLRVRD